MPTSKNLEGFMTSYPDLFDKAIVRYVFAPYPHSGVSSRIR
ncbi:hypothetical protein GRAN_3587 [Granulicella sibirica]|uniref:Uncharacterized protein n=1 Tax=Granulicella sibirica TaxID=2479048 RepID=A0A4V1L545_9BACT|nr:hypothetical protein GRAN_3587 [Granulicella sibirica]